MNKSNLDNTTGLLCSTAIAYILDKLNNYVATVKFNPDYSDVTNTLDFLNRNILKYIGETWRYAYSAANPYLFVSTYGRFYGCFRNQIRAQNTDKKGRLKFTYKYFTKSNHTLSSRHDPHILIYEVFNNTDVKYGNEIHHIDYKNSGHNNNHYDNLIMLTAAEHAELHANEISTFRYTNIPNKTKKSSETINKPINTNNIMNNTNFTFSYLNYCVANNLWDNFDKVVNHCSVNVSNNASKTNAKKYYTKRKEDYTVAEITADINAVNDKIKNEGIILTSKKMIVTAIDKTIGNRINHYGTRVELDKENNKLRLAA